LGSGGQLSINTQGLFGIQANSTDTPSTSDITASSAQGPQGTVIINILNVQPNISPTNLAFQPIANNFVRLCENREKGETLIFNYIGRGGQLPENEVFLNFDQVENPWLELLTHNQPTNSKANKANLHLDSVALFLPCR